MFRRHSRTIAAVVLCFFTWTSGGVFSIAHAAKDAVGNAKAQGEQKKPEERFAKVTEELEETLSDTKADVETKKQRLRAAKSEIEALDPEIRKQFAETEKKLKDAKLPAEIMERHYRFVKHYDDNLAELKGNIERVEKAQSKEEVKVEVEKTLRHLEKVKAPSKHQKLDPNNLPHRQPKANKREPRLKKEEFERDLKKEKNAWRNEKRIMVASVGSLAGLLTSSVVNAVTPPTADDLAETVEVQLTPEIRAKALELGNNPVKIYEWVRNNVEFVPTWGSIQGAQMTLLTRQGNAFDTASLLIALLRAAGIHARYVTGTIELPIDKVMNWAGGFTDPTAALTFMASGGVPIKAGMSGGKITKAQMEHVWVELYAEYGPYSGRPSKLTVSKTWMPLDPTFKQYNYTNGVDLQTVVPFDQQSFFNHVKSTVTINEAEGYVKNVNSAYITNSLTDYQTQLTNYVNQNIPNATVGDMLGKKEVIKQELGIIPASLPYKRITTGVKYSEVADSMRHKITFEVQDSDSSSNALAYTINLAEITGKRITLSYVPATTADEQTLKTYGGLFSVPAYLVNLKPQIKIEGVVKASGNGIGLGNQQTFDMKFFRPNYSSDVVSNKVTAGAYYGIGVNPNKITKELLQQRRIKLESANLAVCGNNINSDDCVGEVLYSTAMAYFYELNTLEDVFAQSFKVADLRHLSEAIVTKDINITSYWGIPTKASEASMIVDVDRIVHSSVSKSGDQSQERMFMTLTGQISSALEHGVFEQLYQAKGVSAVKLLGIANDQGIPIYNVNMNNISTILSKLSIANNVKEDIQNAVSTGKVVTVSERDVTYYGWTGVGYIVTDPITGAGAYMISANLASGGQCIAAGGCSFNDIFGTAFLVAFTALAIEGLIMTFEGLAMAFTLAIVIPFGWVLIPSILVVFVFVAIAFYFLITEIFSCVACVASYRSRFFVRNSTEYQQLNYYSFKERVADLI